MNTNDLYVHAGIGAVYLFGAVAGINALSVIAALAGVVYCGYRIYNEYNNR